jgi:antitoxin HicB
MTEVMIPLTIRKLEEGTYLATSDAIQGLIAEGRTIAETMEIAPDVARKIIESCIEHGDPLPPCMSESIDVVSSVSIPVEIES